MNALSAERILLRDKGEIMRNQDSWWLFVIYLALLRQENEMIKEMKNYVENWSLDKKLSHIKMPKAEEMETQLEKVSRGMTEIRPLL